MKFLAEHDCVLYCLRAPGPTWHPASHMVPVLRTSTCTTMNFEYVVDGPAQHSLWPLPTQVVTRRTYIDLFKGVSHSSDSSVRLLLHSEERFQLAIEWRDTLARLSRACLFICIMSSTAMSRLLQERKQWRKVVPSLVLSLNRAERQFDTADCNCN